MLSWNVQRVSGGLGMLVQHISELEEWDATLLQELSFKDELLSLEELEASFGRTQISDECGVSVGYGHYHSLPVDGFYLVAGLLRHSMHYGLEFERRRSLLSAPRT